MIRQNFEQLKLFLNNSTWKWLLHGNLLIFLDLRFFCDYLFLLSALPSKQEEVISNGTTPCTGANNNSTSTSNNSSSSSTSTSNSKKASSTSNAKSDSSHTAAVPSPPEKDKEKEIKKSGGSSSSGGSTPHIEDLQFMEQTVHKKHNINHYNETDEANEQNAKSFKANGVTRTAKLNSQKDNMANRKGKPNNNTTTVFHNNKDEVIARWTIFLTLWALN